MEPVSLSFVYRREDYVRAVRFYLRKSGALLFWLGLLLMIAVMLLVGVLFHLFGFTPMAAVLLALAGLVLIVDLTVYWVLPGLRFDRNPQLQEKRILHFSVEDIGIQGEQAAGLVPWSYQALWSSRTDYYLIQSRQDYLILPRDAFSSRGDQLRFEQIVQMANPEIRRKDW
ncbi:MAG: hypothetical protein HFE97_03035 [Oscillospiraceae bacterium]|nr:hypothetical protein [Oscillospiraceae bacterium]